MKHIDPNSTVPVFPSLFQIAAFFEDFFPASGFNRSISRVKQLPFADLMSSPERLVELLKSAKFQEDTMDRPRSKASSAKRATRSAAPKRDETGGGENDPERENDNRNQEQLKKVEFVMEAPAANSVKLAADFTDWEKSAVAMRPANNGRWSAVVPLAPGQYSYRYIVDGQWYDDPASTRHAPNPFGTENAVVTVA